MTSWQPGQARYIGAAIAVACLLSLNGCITSSAISSEPVEQASDSGAPPKVSASHTDSAGESNAPLVVRPNLPAVAPQLLGEDPNDDLNIAKRYFRQGSYALAERHFRKAVELHPSDAESWVGLAASYDQLRRFDLASRAYEKALKIIGPTPELLNNQGFSYILRGDYRRARHTLQAAQARDPANPYVANNLKLLDRSERKSKSVN